MAGSRGAAAFLPGLRLALARTGCQGLLVSVRRLMAVVSIFVGCGGDTPVEGGMLEEPPYYEDCSEGAGIVSVLVEDAQGGPISGSLRYRVGDGVVDVPCAGRCELDLGPGAIADIVATNAQGCAQYGYARARDVGCESTNIDPPTFVFEESCAAPCPVIDPKVDIDVRLASCVDEACTELDGEFGVEEGNSLSTQCVAQAVSVSEWRLIDCVGGPASGRLSLTWRTSPPSSLALSEGDTVQVVWQRLADIQSWRINELGKSGELVAWYSEGRDGIDPEPLRVSWSRQRCASTWDGCELDVPLGVQVFKGAPSTAVPSGTAATLALGLDYELRSTRALVHFSLCPETDANTHPVTRTSLARVP